VFSRAEVPRALLRDRRQRLPIDLLARLYAGGAEVTGDPLFGFSVGRTMRPADYGLWAEYAAQAPTLGAAMSRAKRTLHIHQTGSTMRLAGRPSGLVAWEYWHREIAAPLFRHHSEHVLAVMINFVRRYLGNGWNPSGVEMCYPRSDGDRDREQLTESIWAFDRSCVAITIPETLLASRAPLRDAETAAARRVLLADVLAQARSPRLADLLDQAETIITLRLLEGATDIDGAARMLRTSPRTLQRYLHEEGLSYRALVARTRMQQARQRIEGTDAPLKSIGYDLGYLDPADFTRAFRRYFGFPPSLLREQAARRVAG
jgi:AraC-like DNA-binding protein